MIRMLKTAAFFLLAALPLSSIALERIELLPPDAQAYVRISNTTNFWAQLKKSSVGQLWQDRQFQDFIGNPDAEDWRELISWSDNEAENEVFMEQLKMLTGEIVLAFDMESEEPYIIAAMTKEDFELSLELDDKLNELQEERIEILKDSFQDVEIIRHIEGAGTDSEYSIWQAHLNGTLVFGDSKEWIEQSIVRLQKEEIKEPEGNPVCNINLPLSALIKETLSGDETEEAIYEAMGLLDIEKLNSTIVLKNDEMVADTTLTIENMEHGFFTLLETEPSELPTVTFIPENISSLEVGRFNLLALWQEVPEFLTTVMPEMKPQFDMAIGMLRQQTGIDLEQDLLVHLGTKYLSYTGAEGEKQSSVMALELKDSDAFKQGVETAMASPAIQPYVANGLEVIDFLEHTIYTLKEGDPANPLGVALIDGYLLYGTPDGLRQAIRSVTSDAAENQNFEKSELVQGLRKEVPPSAFGYNAIDWKKNMDIVIHELTKPEYSEMIVQQWAQSGSPLPPPDMDKLPPTDHIAEFFNLSYQYVEACPAGLHQKIILKY